MNREQSPWDLYPLGRRKRFLFVLFLVGASSYVDKNIIGVLLEQIKAEFRVSDAMLGLLSGISFALFYASFGIPVARWADRGDRKAVITFALLIWSAMTALCGLASTFWQLALARFGVGAGEAGAMPPAQSLLADYYPPTERARAIGVFMMCSPVGYAIGLVLGGFIAQHYGWRAAFIAVGVFGILIAPLAWCVLQEPRHLPQFRARHDDQEPMLATVRTLLAKPAYRYILMAIVIHFLMGYGVLVFVVSLMIRLYGLNVAQAGATFGVISALGAIVGNLVGGMMADQFAKRDFALVPRMAGWTMIVAVFLFDIALAAPTIVVLAPLLFVAMAVLNAILPPMFSALHLVCGSKRRAMAVAVAFFLANLLGVGLGPVIAGALSDFLSSIHGPAEGLRYALMIVMAVLVPGGALMLRAARHFESALEA
jgi:predicted MFS family arabinose efflux permease